MDRDRLTQEIAHGFAARSEHPAAVYLFGSVARGDDRPDSDVDLAALYGKPVDPGLAGLKLALAGDLEERLGRRVDLVVLDNQSPDFIHHVLRDGLLVLENDRSARIRFEVTARNEYFDVLPRLQEYRRVGGSHRTCRQPILGSATLTPQPPRQRDAEAQPKVGVRATAKHGAA